MRKRISLLVSTLALVALASMAHAAGTTRFAVQDANSVDKAVIQDNGYIGIGTNNPSGPVHVISNGNTLTSAGFTMQHTANTVGGVDPTVAIAPNFSLYRNNDVTLNSGLPRSGDSLGYFGFGSIVSGALRNRAILFANAENAWAGTDNSTFFQFMTNPGAGAGNREILRLSGVSSIATVNGGLRLYPYTGPGSTTPVGTGAPVPTKPACSASTQGTLWFTKNATAKDTLEICANTGANGTTYGWNPISF